MLATPSQKTRGERDDRGKANQNESEGARKKENMRTPDSQPPPPVRTPVQSGIKHQALFMSPEAHGICMSSMQAAVARSLASKSDAKDLAIEALRLQMIAAEEAKAEKLIAADEAKAEKQLAADEALALKLTAAREMGVIAKAYGVTVNEDCGQLTEYTYQLNEMLLFGSGGIAGKELLPELTPHKVLGSAVSAESYGGAGSRTCANLKSDVESAATNSSKNLLIHSSFARDSDTQRNITNQLESSDGESGIEGDNVTDGCARPVDSIESSHLQNVDQFAAAFGSRASCNIQVTKTATGDQALKNRKVANNTNEKSRSHSGRPAKKAVPAKSIASSLVSQNGTAMTQVHELHTVMEKYGIRVSNPFHWRGDFSKLSIDSFDLGPLIRSIAFWYEGRYLSITRINGRIETVEFTCHRYCVDCDPKKSGRKCHCRGAKECKFRLFFRLTGNVYDLQQEESIFEHSCGCIPTRKIPRGERKIQQFMRNCPPIVEFCRECYSRSNSLDELTLRVAVERLAAAGFSQEDVDLTRSIFTQLKKHLREASLPDQENAIN